VSEVGNGVVLGGGVQVGRGPIAPGEPSGIVCSVGSFGWSVTPSF
jgi:hypothetical protein